MLRRDRWRCRHQIAPGSPVCGADAAEVRQVIAGAGWQLANLAALCDEHDPLTDKHAAPTRRKHR